MAKHKKAKAGRKDRLDEARSHAPERKASPTSPTTHFEDMPAAGAHAAAHLINEDATPGAGVLPGYSRFGREVDGAAG